MSKHDRPNVVLIVLDTLRARNMSLYGYPESTTPFLDELAAKSVLFRNACAPSSWTLPSHASIFTGLYPSRHGANGKRNPLKSGTRTLARYLQEKGYSTVSFSANPWVDDRFGIMEGFETKHRFWHWIDSADPVPDAFRKPLNGMEYRMRSWLLDKGACRINRAVRRDLAVRENPFFCFINYNETHSPYFPRLSFLKKHFPERSFFNLRRVSAISDDREFYLFGDRPFPPENDMRTLHELYDLEIRYVDERLRSLFAVLEENRRLNDTLLIITSDHGESIGEHGLLKHSISLYDTLVKVPLLVRHPDFRAEEKPGYVEVKQIFATIAAELFGEDAARFIDAANTRSLFSKNPEDTVFFEQPVVHLKRDSVMKKIGGEVLRNGFWFDQKLKCAVRGGVKLIRSSTGRDELFDLNRDPEETTNRVSDPTYTAMADDLRNRIERYLGGFAADDSSSDRHGPDDEADTALRNLGYL
jgi:arylsulfatase A-like enzyme